LWDLQNITPPSKAIHEKLLSFGRGASKSSGKFKIEQNYIADKTRRNILFVPIKEGNGRIGRMLITLMMWSSGVISAPHFYISSYLEEQKDVYIDTMRDVSEGGDWTNWVVFF
jgi:hypothetical protein